MSVVERIIGRIDALSPRPAKLDRLVLNSEERASPHLVGYSEGGRQVRISLPRGHELNDGDVLAVEGDTAIIVAAANEDLYVVRPKDAHEAGIAGYQLGNLHRPVRFTPDALLTPYDPMVADLLDRLGIAFERRKAPFVGMRFGAYAAHHHHGPEKHAAPGHSHGSHEG